MALSDLNIENPPPYRTPLIADNQKIVAKQWVIWFNWLAETIQKLLDNTIIDISDLTTDGVVNSSTLGINNLINAINTLLVTQPCLNNNIEQIKSLINQLGVTIINTSDSQLIKNKSAVTAIKNIDSDVVLIPQYHRILADSTSNTITITLPDCRTCKGKEFIIYGFAVTNTITVETVLSQEIKRVMTDTATSDNINLSDVIYYVSQGAYWVAN